MSHEQSYSLRQSLNEWTQIEHNMCGRQAIVVMTLILTKLAVSIIIQWAYYDIIVSGLQ